MRDTGKVSKAGNSRMPPKKRSRAEHPLRVEEARKAYAGRLLEGLSYADAYLRAKPRTRASRHSMTALGKQLCDWYEQNAPADMLETLQMHGMGKDRLAEETEKRLTSETLKEVVETVVKKASKKEGNAKPVVYTIRKTIAVEDNATRMRATELLADMLGARKRPDEATGPQQQVIVMTAVISTKPPGSGE